MVARFWRTKYGLRFGGGGHIFLRVCLSNEDKTCRGPRVRFQYKLEVPSGIRCHGYLAIMWSQLSVVSGVATPSTHLEKDAFVPHVVGVAHGGVHADVGRHAGEDDVSHASRSQHLLPRDKSVVRSSVVLHRAAQ